MPAINASPVTLGTPVTAIAQSTQQGTAVASQANTPQKFAGLLNS